MELNSKKQSLLDSLRYIIDRAHAAKTEKDPKIFLTIEHEFAEKLALNPQIIPIQKSITDLEKKDKASSTALSEKAPAEINAAECRIRAYVEENKIQINAVTQNLDVCKVQQGYLDGQYFSLKLALFALHDDPLVNHDDLIKQFATTKTCNKIVEPSYKSIIYENKLNRIALEKRKNDKLKKLRHVKSEICSHVSVIKDNITADNPTLQSVDKDLNLFQESEKKCIESNDEMAADHYLKVCHILTYGALAKLARLNEFMGNKHLSFFKSLGIIKEARWIDQFNFAPSFDLYLQELARLEKCQETKIWHACNKVYDVYQNYAKYVLETVNTLEHLNYMEKIFSHLKESLPEDKSLPIPSKQDYVKILAWNYNHSTKTFIIIIKHGQNPDHERIEIPLQDNKFLADILHVITKNKKMLKSKWENRELNEKIDHSNIKKNKVYFSIKSFAQQLALATKIDTKAFFIYKTKTTQIKPEIADRFDPKVI